MPVRDYTTKVPPVPPLMGSVLSHLGIIRNALNKLIRIPDFDTYTPALTNVANLDGSTAATWLYIRVGDIVFASGRLTANATAGAGAATRLRMTLPIASDLGTLTGGAWLDYGTAITPIRVYADTVNNEAELLWYSQSTSNDDVGAWFLYQIV